MVEFKSLYELMTYVQNYEKQHFIQLWMRDTRKIETMKKICPIKLIHCNSELKYYSVTFTCSRGGRKYKYKTDVKDGFTDKDDCPMNIKVKMSPCGQKLQIKSFNENHNHIIDKNLFLKKKRRPRCEEKKEPETVLLQIFKNNTIDHNAPDSQNNLTTDRILTIQQKYKIAVSKCQQIASIISSFGTEEFNSTCTGLDELIKYLGQEKNGDSEHTRLTATDKCSHKTTAKAIAKTKTKTTAKATAKTKSTAKAKATTKTRTMAKTKAIVKTSVKNTMKAPTKVTTNNNEEAVDREVENNAIMAQMFANQTYLFVNIEDLGNFYTL